MMHSSSKVPKEYNGLPRLADSHPEFIAIFEIECRESVAEEVLAEQGYGRLHGVIMAVNCPPRWIVLEYHVGGDATVVWVGRISYLRCIMKGEVSSQ